MKQMSKILICIVKSMMFMIKISALKMFLNFRNLFSLGIQTVGFLELFVNYLTKAITHSHGQQVVLIVNVCSTIFDLTNSTTEAHFHPSLYFLHRPHRFHVENQPFWGLFLKPSHHVFHCSSTFQRQLQSTDEPNLVRSCFWYGLLFKTLT